MKKAIVTASFGCSIRDSREKYIETIENRIKNEYKDIDCFKVFTSEMIRAKIKREENIYIDNINTCLEKLKKNGYTHVYVVVTHMIPGFEYEKIVKGCESCRYDFEEIKISRPFLDGKMGQEEIDAVKSYLNTSLKEDEAIVLAGHGTDHESHKYYKEFEKKLNKEIPDLYIANIEGNPFIDDILDTLKIKKYKKIYLIPFLIVAGDHVLNDIASDNEDSIKAKLCNNGFEAEALVTGLGADEKVAELFAGRLKELLRTSYGDFK